MSRGRIDEHIVDELLRLRQVLILHGDSCEDDARTSVLRVRGERRVDRRARTLLLAQTEVGDAERAVEIGPRARAFQLDRSELGNQPSKVSLPQQRLREQRIGFVGRVLELDRLAGFGLGPDRVAGRKQGGGHQEARLATVRGLQQRVLELDDRGLVIGLRDVRFGRCDVGRRVGAIARGEYEAKRTTAAILEGVGRTHDADCSWWRFEAGGRRSST